MGLIKHEESDPTQVCNLPTRARKHLEPLHQSTSIIVDKNQNV